MEDYLESKNHPYSLSEVWAKGGEGAVDLARKVIKEIDTKPNNFTRMYNDEDRLKTPLIRTIIDGEETFREASWEEALDLIASKMDGISKKYGPESFALLKHGSSGSHFEHLFKSYGSDTIGEPAYAQCRGPREAAFALTA